MPSTISVFLFRRHAPIPIYTHNLTISIKNVDNHVQCILHVHIHYKFGLENTCSNNVPTLLWIQLNMVITIVLFLNDYISVYCVRLVERKKKSFQFWFFYIACANT